MPDSDFWDEEEELIVAALMALYIETLMAGVDGGILALPVALRALVDVDKINESALGQSVRFRDAILNGIHVTTKTQAEAVIRQWQIIGNGDIGMLNDMLEGVFSDNRADMISITETTKAFQDGNQLAWQSLGMYVMYMQWNTQRDERVCPICAPKDGQIEPIMSSDRPPAHPRCRCFTTPVIPPGLKP